MKNLLGALLLLAVALSGQSRDAYRVAYDAWQKTQANLEREAGTAGTTLIPRADDAAAAVARFETARAAYLAAYAQDAARRKRFMEIPSTRISPDAAPQAIADLAAAELQLVTRTSAKFANDPDRAIQQLRQSLEREKAALASLTEAIQARQTSVAAASATAAALDEDRVKTAAAFGKEAAQLTDAVAQLEKESAAWGDYYAKLNTGINLGIQLASAPPPPPPPPVSVTPAPTSPPERNDSAPRVSLARFVGGWTYPSVNGIFRGAQPESIDLEVHEQDGRATGTLTARFKPSTAAGPATDPVLKFDFEGDFTATPNQRFKLVTADKAQGTVELIPGPAFNLLEVNFQTDSEANKVRLGNFILVKK
jgi:hypothetical protein